MEHSGAVRNEAVELESVDDLSGKMRAIIYICN
jgi:hypothetical protein